MKNKGFTLIELIIVTIILAVLAAVAIPRYASTVSSNEAAAEDAVIASIRSGLDIYATDMLIMNGREYWPDNPFDALQEKPKGYISSIDNDGTTDGNADSDGEWTYNTSTKRITHQRGDNTRYYWSYDAGVNVDLNDGGGSSLPPFNPPWNDGNTSNWSDWCDFELNEGCYACQNNSGAGLYCNDQCAAAGCPGFTASTPPNDDNNSVGQGIGNRGSF